MGFYLSLFMIFVISFLITSNNVLESNLSNNKIEKIEFKEFISTIFLYFSISFFIYTLIRIVYHLVYKDFIVFDSLFCLFLFIISIILFCLTMFNLSKFMKKNNIKFEEIITENKENVLLKKELKEFNTIKDYINISLFNLENKKQFNKLKKEVLKLEDSILDTYKCNSKSSKKTYNNNLKVYKEVSLMLIHKDLLNENKIKNIINFVKKNKIDYI